MSYFKLHCRVRYIAAQNRAFSRIGLILNGPQSEFKLHRIRFWHFTAVPNPLRRWKCSGVHGN